MPNITYQPCDSSQIHSFGYDQATQTLGVKFPVRERAASTVVLPATGEATVVSITHKKRRGAAAE